MAKNASFLSISSMKTVVFWEFLYTLFIIVLTFWMLFFKLLFFCCFYMFKKKNIPIKAQLETKVKK